MRWHQVVPSSNEWNTLFWDGAFREEQFFEIFVFGNRREALKYFSASRVDFRQISAGALEVVARRDNLSRKGLRLRCGAQGTIGEL